MSGPEPPITFRHRDMMIALEAARAAVETPISETERLDGWNEEILGYVRRWFDDCQSQLSHSPHPLRRMRVSWGRGFDDVPGRAFDPRVEDPRKGAILRASNALTWVVDFEHLWMSVTALKDRLVGNPVELGVSREVVTGVAECLGSLRDRLAIDRPVSSEEMSGWQDSLTRYGAEWVDRYGQPWAPGGREGRFWRDQSGELWTALAPIARSSSEIDWNYWISNSEQGP